MKRVLLAALVSAAFAAPAVMAETADIAPDLATLAQAELNVGATGAAPQGPMHHRAFVRPSERVEARIAYARTALKITDAQQPQWDNFANVLRKQAREMDQRFEQFRAQRAQGAARPERRQFTAIDRLERRQQRMTQGSQRLGEVIAAAKPLYAVLSPEQKVVADGMISRQGHGGHGRNHHRGMRGGPA